MTKFKRGDDRDELLADVAEMYYESGHTQAEISKAIGVTRSAVSRMLTEARQKGIVDIRIRRPLRFDPALGSALAARFGLQDAIVVSWQEEAAYDRLRERLANAASLNLRSRLSSGMTVGVAWGTTVSATIEALEIEDPIAVRAVQLVGVLGSQSHSFNAHSLVSLLAQKMGGDSVHLYTPAIVEDADTARSLLGVENVREVIAAAQQCDIALLGIGTTHPEYCSLYQGGHITMAMLRALQDAGAVGDVCARYFNIEGRLLDIEFHERLVGISNSDLLAIPVRLGVAGGAAKAEAILGALRGDYVNVLVTDSSTAEKVLALDDAHR